LLEKFSHDAVPAIVIAFVALLCFWQLARMFIRYFRVRSQLNLAIAELAKVQSPQALVGAYGSLFQFFTTRVPLLGHPWKEFDESLIKSKDAIYNTIDADHFFSSETFIHGPLEAEFNRHLPGIFTACGIVGTFFGIQSGLSEAVKKLSLGTSGENSVGLLTEATTSLRRKMSSRVRPLGGRN